MTVGRRKRRSGARPIRIWSIPVSGEGAALAMLTAFFLLGGGAGCVMASWVGGGGSAGLAEYIRAYLISVQEGLGSSPSVWAVLWDAVRYPVAVLVLGFTALGLVGIPAAFALRGFFLSFAVASFVRMFGWYGLLLAGIIFGVPGTISVPVLFLLGTQGWTASRAMAARLSGTGRHASPYGRLYWTRCGVCGVGLLLCVCVEQVVTVRLLAAAAGWI